MAVKSFVDCSQFNTVPCVTVELINCDCDRYQLDVFQTAFFSPHRNYSGEFRLRFCDGDIPAEFVECCAGIEVVIDWPEVGINNYPAFYGQFNSYNNDPNGVNEWRGNQLIDKLADTVIAYKATTAGATKSGLTAIEAAYEYMVENLETPLVERGDGTACAVATPDCFSIEEPSAALIAASPAWSGSRSYDNLLSTVQKIANFGDFNFSVTRDDDCCCIVSFSECVDKSDVIISECLENVTITQLQGNCRTYDRIHMLGGGEDVDRLVVTVCSDDIDDACCLRETSFENNDETDPLALEIEGQEILDSQSTKEKVLFDTAWSCGFLPWRDLEIGDVVTIEDSGQYKVDQLPFSIAYSDNGIQLVSVSPIFEAV